MTVLFCEMTLVPHEEKLAIKGSNCDAEHITLVQLLLGFLQVKVTLISQSLFFMALCKLETIWVILQE